MLHNFVRFAFHSLHKAQNVEKHHVIFMMGSKKAAQFIAELCDSGIALQWHSQGNPPQESH